MLCQRRTDLIITNVEIKDIGVIALFSLTRPFILRVNFSEQF
jgi:hypothetical protein